MGAIEAGHYGEAVQQLMADPIVIAMAAEMRGYPREQLAHDDGSPRFEFMQAANRQYDKRGGTIHAHIGAVAEALLKLAVPGE